MGHVRVRLRGGDARVLADARLPQARRDVFRTTYDPLRSIDRLWAAFRADALAQTLSDGDAVPVWPDTAFGAGDAFAAIEPSPESRDPKLGAAAWAATDLWTGGVLALAERRPSPGAALMSRVPLAECESGAGL